LEGNPRLRGTTFQSHVRIYSTQLSNADLAKKTIPVFWIGKGKKCPSKNKMRKKFRVSVNNILLEGRRLHLDIERPSKRKTNCFFALQQVLRDSVNVFNSCVIWWI
jgi:hypothetical protein